MGEIAILDRTESVRRGRRLEYFTIAWNAVEGVVGVVTGLLAGSISLVGFGIDSFIEVTSGSVLLWRMSVDANEGDRERNEKRALKVVGICFSALAAYIAYESIADLCRPGRGAMLLYIVREDEPDYDPSELVSVSPEAEEVGLIAAFSAYLPNAVLASTPLVLKFRVHDPAKKYSPTVDISSIPL